MAPPMNYGGAAGSLCERVVPVPPPREVDERQWLPRRTGRATTLVMLCALLGTLSVVGYGSASLVGSPTRTVGNMLTSKSSSGSNKKATRDADDGSDDGAADTRIKAKRTADDDGDDGVDAKRVSDAGDDDGASRKRKKSSEPASDGRVTGNSGGRSSEAEEDGDQPPSTGGAPTDDSTASLPEDDAASAPDVSSGSSDTDEYTITLMPTECSVKMANFCRLHMRVASTTTSGITISVAYRPEFNVSHAARIWSPTQHYDAVSNAWDVPMYRLRANTRYTFSVYGLSDDATPNEQASLLSHGYFTTPESGISWIDEGALGNVEKTQTPAYSVIYFAAETEEFQGLVGIDGQGYVVWYHSAGGQVLAFDQYDDYRMVYNYFPDDMFSGLGNVSPEGESVGSDLVIECQGSGENFQQVNHEARVTKDGTGILTLLEIVRLTDNGKALNYVQDSNITSYIGDTIAFWDKETSVLTPLVDLNDFWDPMTVNLRRHNSMTLETVVCSDEAEEEANVLDWMHPSSISEHADVYVVALRNLDAVAAINKDTKDVKWVLSSNGQMNSNFTWEHEHDKFYDPHDAQMISEDELILLDDGNNRPGCTKPYDDNCFTRAVHYKLDFETMTVKLLWHFEYPLVPGPNTTLAEIKQQDIYVSDGGSIRYLNDRYYIAFTTIDVGTTYAHWGWVFEVDQAKRVTGTVKVPRKVWDDFPSGMYRAVPYESVGGESERSPSSFNIMNTQPLR